ncbi:hypothetical protein D3C76_806050 [compost metagenome]
MIQVAKVSHRKRIQGTPPAVDVVGAVQIAQAFAQRLPVGVRIVKLSAFAEGPLVDHRHLGEPLAARFKIRRVAFGGQHGGQQKVILPSGPCRRLVNHIERRAHLVTQVQADV